LTGTSSRRIFNDAVSLLAIYYCGDQMKNNEKGMEYDMHWREGKSLQACLGKFRRKGPLGRSRPRWEYDIEVGLIKMGWKGADSLTGSGQGQVLGYCAHSNENMDWWFWYPGMWCCIPGLHYSITVENSKPTTLSFNKLQGISWFTLLYGDWLACWLVSQFSSLWFVSLQFS